MIRKFSTVQKPSYINPALISDSNSGTLNFDEFSKASTLKINENNKPYSVLFPSSSKNVYSVPLAQDSMQPHYDEYIHLSQNSLKAMPKKFERFNNESQYNNNDNDSSYSKSFTKEHAYIDNHARRFSQPQQDSLSAVGSTQIIRNPNLLKSVEQDPVKRNFLANNSPNSQKYSNHRASSTRISQV